MRPSDVIATRRIMLDYLQSFWTRRVNQPDPDPHPEQMLEALAHASHHLPESAAYLVTEDMAELAMRAAQTIPDSVHFADLPAETGFVLYERPIASFPMYEAEPMPVTGAIWGPMTFQGGENGVALVPLGKSAGGPVSALPLPIASWGGDSPNGPWPMFNDYSGAAAVVHATWAIMQQTLTISVSAYADRAESRRSTRAGLPADLVIIHLRKRRTEDPNPADNTSVVDWSHRWLVSGHWRNQWLPSRSCHRPQWIDPYVKGPEDRPLILKERVHVWSR
jgi:hypothetical protein